MAYQLYFAYGVAGQDVSARECPNECKNLEVPSNGRFLSEEDALNWYELTLNRTDINESLDFIFRDDEGYAYFPEWHGSDLKLIRA